MNEEITFESNETPLKPSSELTQEVQTLTGLRYRLQALLQHLNQMIPLSISVEFIQISREKLDLVGSINFQE